ncbi:MAG: diaminopimelate epimerase [Gemmatales bacterium]|nr:diaminopimelate epimerase [Gemmatales bacterium]MCS7160563.1 diaminopimelate epimerase [Gemmatales bacterium]MDW8175764.1 diaminopimelate epimerase [Gemmatales bacterium]MDW8222347.1 diaminopimelate epimerase [Gemmatales bacterium]
MRFVKMHGCGNDYIYIDCFRQAMPPDPGGLSRRMSDRHFGVGGDGLILICPSPHADARMRMFNSDGSEAEMCGNGIRCLAKYLYDHGLVSKSQLRIETGRGILDLELHVRNGRVDSVTVDMGEPIFEPSRIPTTLPGQPPCNILLTLEDCSYLVTSLSMGNPHCVIYVDELTDRDVLHYGPKVERHPAFPRRVNVEFVKVISPREVRMRVWERGSGETLACGTGACAVCVAGVITGRTQRRLLAHLLGGDLELYWSETNNHVYMTGPAVEVFQGDWPD